MKIVALATCHNRREMTLRALSALQGQILPVDCDFRICVVDDGSSDGTRQAVAASFPSAVVLEGPGNLYWAGGMRFGWNNYAKLQNPDYLLVFNDDAKFSGNAVETLLSVGRYLKSEGCGAFVVSGALINPETGDLTYGGSVRKSWWHPLRFQRIQSSDAVQDCDAVNMNIALISRKALSLVGFLADEYTHGKADYDFALRLRAAGGRAVLAPGFVGECYVNSIEGTSSQLELTFAERWRRLTSVKEQAPRERAVFYRQHGGWFWPVYWVLPYLRVGIESGMDLLRRTLNRRRSR